jgi:hypothetical protein
VALGNVNLKLCEKGNLHGGLCVTYAEDCALSLCTKQTEMSVVNGTTNTKSIDEDFGCLSKVHEDSGYGTTGAKTHCWQAGTPCGDLEFVDLTSATIDHTSPTDYIGFDFCPDDSDGIVVQTDTFTDTVQDKLLARLTGNQTTVWSNRNAPTFDEKNPIADISQWTISQPMVSVLSLPESPHHFLNKHFSLILPSKR